MFLSIELNSSPKFARSTNSLKCPLYPHSLPQFKAFMPFLVLIERRCFGNGRNAGTSMQWTPIRHFLSLLERAALQRTAESIRVLNRIQILPESAQCTCKPNLPSFSSDPLHRSYVAHQSSNETAVIPNCGISDLVNLSAE